MADVQKQMRDVSADLQSHAYDLSERHLFSAKAGQLLPIYNKQVVPGDYFEIDPVSFLRSQRVNTASYARMRQHVDFFFVPYWQLWHLFPEMKYQREDPTSTAYGYNGVRGLPRMSPYMTLRDLYAQIFVANPESGGTEVGSALSNKKDEFGYLEVCNRARLCDLLGYGSVRQLVRRYQGDSTTVAQVPALVPNTYDPLHVTIWPWLAYQKIWSDYYRNPWFDLDPDPWTFNLDDIPSTNEVYANIARRRVGSSYEAGKYYTQLDGFFKLRYRQWKRDYFTGLFPNAQFGDVAQIIGSSYLRSSYPDGFPAAGVSIEGTGFNPNDDGTLYASSSDGNYPLTLIGGISSLDVRRAELLQIWKEKTLRAGSRTVQQQIAHFGVGSEYIPDDHVRHLGGYSEIVNISEVVSTSLDKTGLSQNDKDGLGELGGKGTSLGKGEKIRFKAKDDGIIMAIFSILPESEYNAYGLQPDHQRIDPFDYFTPAFQNLGFTAVTRANLDIINITSQIASRPATQPIGYAPPYYDMKTGMDKVHGEFMIDTSMTAAMTNIWANYDRRGGSLQAFDSARRDATELVGTLPFFYVNPNVVDPVFAFNADSFEDSDEFFVNMFLDIKAVRPMSVLGLPNF